MVEREGGGEEVKEIVVYIVLAWPSETHFVGLLGIRQSTRVHSFLRRMCLLIATRIAVFV